MTTFKPISEQQRQSEIAEFLCGNSWDWVYRHWSKRLADFATPVDPLFKVAEIRVSESTAGRPFDLVWWPRREFSSELSKCQKHFDQYPNTQGPTHPSGQSSKGQLHTLELLHAHQDCPEVVAAILISASVFDRLGSTNGYYPESDYWPKRYCVRAFYDLANSVWQHAGMNWHHSSKWVLPSAIDDYAYRIESLGALIRYLAEEHAATLQRFVPTKVIFTSASAPKLRSV